MPHDVVGIAGAPVRAIVVGSHAAAIEAWVASVDDVGLRSPGARDAASLALMHNEVVDTALRTGRTPLPARFGQWFTDDAACAADIARRAGAWRALLARVAGCVEMSVLLAPVRPVPRAHEPQSAPKPRVDDPQAGRQYLEALRARIHSDAEARNAAASELERVTGLLGPFVRAVAKPRSERGVFAISHLVARDSEKDYRQALRRIKTREDFRLIVSGPRAPYSFARASSAEESGHESGSLISND